MPRLPPAHDGRRPRVAGARREEQHGVPVADAAVAHRAVEAEERIDAAHVARVVEVDGLILGHSELGQQRLEHGALRVQGADEVEVAQREAGALRRAAGGGDEVRQGLLVEPAFHLRRVLDVEEPVAVGVDRAAAGDLDLQRVRTVGDGVRPEHLVALGVADEEARHGAVSEVEHEARLLVLVVEQVRLATRGDDEDVLELRLRAQQVARDAQGDRRAVRDVVVLDREGVRRTDAVGDVRRGLPDGVVAPHRAVVHDDVDVLRIEAGLVEQALDRLDRQVADVLVGGGDVLAAQPELLHDHPLRDAGQRRDLRSGHPPLRQVRSGRKQAYRPHSLASRMQRMIRASSSVTRSGIGSPSPQRIQRIPTSSPSPISA